MKYIINVSNDPKTPSWKGGPNLPITIIKEIKEKNLEYLKCDTPKKCDTPGPLQTYPPSGVRQGYVPKVPSLYEILGEEYEPCFVHNVGYQFFITVRPNTKLEEWDLTCEPSKASGVVRNKLIIPFSKDIDDTRTFTTLWTKGTTKEKMTVWMPEEVLRNESAIHQYGAMCKGRLGKVIRWVENRYGCVLIFEKRLGRPEFEFELEELDPDTVVVDRLPGDDEYFNASKGPIAYETTNKTKAADVSARARNARIIAEELKSTRENQELLIVKLTDIETTIYELAEGQIVQGENLMTITNVLSSLIGKEDEAETKVKETSPGDMFG